MSDIETSAETFESILKGILEKGDDQDINKLGSEIENKTLLKKLNLAKEDDDDFGGDYKFDENENIQELTDDEKRKIVFVLKDNYRYFEDCENEINKLVEICPKDIDLIKTEIDSKIGEMIKSNNKEIINEAYKELKLGDGNIMMAAIRNNNIPCYQQYKEIEEAIREDLSKLNKCNENFKKLFNEICVAK